MCHFTHLERLAKDLDLHTNLGSIERAELFLHVISK
ncbi:hypothetical protein X975_15243, partial [Stegodyphus mimosarum]